MNAVNLALEALKNCRREMKDWNLEHPATKQTDAAIAALEALQEEQTDNGLSRTPVLKCGKF